MSYGSRGGHSYGGNLLRRARKVQAKRSAHAKAIDSQLKAPRARSVTQWLSAPNRFDLPTIDTNKHPKNESYRMTQKEFNKEYDKDNYAFDRLINKDYIEENNSANKKIVEKIFAVLDKNAIPYYYGGEDSGIQVRFNDLESAQKLVEKLNADLRKTLE